jgi:Mg/Co/Ni transporter MgtE
MEKLRSIHAPEDPQYLHPKTDVFLFSSKDQRDILSQFHGQGQLVPYLACIDSADRGRWLASFSERQQALILDALGRVDAMALDERMSRNALIDLIRRLQDEGRISTAVKYA